MNIFTFITARQSKGFSLVELLVVISVIGILTTVITANFTTSRAKAKDRAFVAEMKEAQLAIELYKSQYGQYPPAATSPPGCVGSNSILDRAQNEVTGSCSDTTYIGGIVPDFMESLPKASDAANSNCAIYYYVDTNNASWYKLMGTECMSDGTTIGPDDELVLAPNYCDGLPPDSRQYTANTFYESSVAIYSPGGECY